MKKFLCISCLCIIAGTAGMTDIYAFAENNNNITSVAREFSETGENGYITSKRVNMATGEEYQTTNSDKNKYSLKGAENLPEKIDLRDYDLITSVKNQGSDGLCWAFACCGVMENSVIKNGYEGLPSLYKTAGKPNFSEAHMGYYPFISTEESPDRLEGEKKGSSGGNSYYAMSAVASGVGLVGENTFPIDIRGQNAPDRFKNMGTFALESADIIYQNSENSREILKSWLAQGYCASISYYSNNGKLVEKVNPNTGENVAGFYQTDVTVPNHQVTVIGYDDNFSKELFSGGTPQEDGAFLIKNSWGESYGVGGYMWLSYYDPSICEFAKFNLKPMDYDNIYQYDSAFTNTAFTFEKTANIFTAKENEILKSVGIENPNDQETIATAEIYKLNKDYKNPTDGTKVATLKNSFISEGFKSIKLEKPIELEKGEAFSVVVSLKCGNNNGLQFVEMNGSANLAQYTSNAGESYVYTFDNNGRYGWFDTVDIDMEDYGLDYGGSGKIGNACIKAYTENVASVDKSKLQELVDTQAIYNFGNLHSDLKSLYTYAIQDAKYILAGDNSVTQYEVDGICKQLEWVYEHSDIREEYNIASVEDWLNMEKLLEESKWQNIIDEINITADINFNNSDVFEYDQNGLVCGYDKDNNNIIKINGFKQFKGNLNGNGHTLSGIVIDSAEKNAGIINVYNGNGTISDISIKNSYIKGEQMVGSLVGTVENNSFVCDIKNINVQNCMVECAERGYGNRLGGVIGQMTGSGSASINGCSFLGNIADAEELIGGVSEICGSFGFGEISKNQSQDIYSIDVYKSVDSGIASSSRIYMCASYLEDRVDIKLKSNNSNVSIESLQVCRYNDSWEKTPIPFTKNLINQDENSGDVYISIDKNDINSNNIILDLKLVTNILKGDVDGNGELSSNDALEILKMVVGITQKTVENSYIADMDGDSEVTTLDALQVLKKVVGLV